MKPTGPTYEIRITSMPSEIDPDSRLAQWLKQGMRRYKFRCKSAKKVEVEIKPVVRKRRTTQKAMEG